MSPEVDHNFKHFESKSPSRTQASTPDYATLEFSPASRMSSRGKSPDGNMIVTAPKRGIKPLKNNHFYHHQHAHHHPYQSRSVTPHSQRIYQNIHRNSMYTSRTMDSHHNFDHEEDPEVNERDRQFATAICK